MLDQVLRWMQITTVQFFGPWRMLMVEEADARGITVAEFIRRAVESLVPGAHDRAVALGWKRLPPKEPRDPNKYTVRKPGRPHKPAPEGRRDKPGSVRLGNKNR